jgi:hypothetical protein
MESFSLSSASFSFCAPTFVVELYLLDVNACYLFMIEVLVAIVSDGQQIIHHRLIREFVKNGCHGVE